MAKINITVVTAQCEDDLDDIVYKTALNYFDVQEIDGKVKIIRDGLTEKECYEVYDKICDSGHVYQSHADDYLLDRMMAEHMLMYSMKCKVDDHAWNDKGFEDYVRHNSLYYPSAAEIDEYFAERYPQLASKGA